MRQLGGCDPARHSRKVGPSGPSSRSPDFSFRLMGPVDGHHNQCRFRWELGPRGSDAPVVGFDVAVVGDGTIQTVLGFLDRVPAG